MVVHTGCEYSQHFFLENRLPASIQYYSCNILVVCEPSNPIIFTLVVPQWVSALFWPLLFPDGKKAATFIKQVVKLPRLRDLFLPGQTGLNIFNGTPNTAVLALCLSFVDAAVAAATN